MNDKKIENAIRAKSTKPPPPEVVKYENDLFDENIKIYRKVLNYLTKARDCFLPFREDQV